MSATNPANDLDVLEQIARIRRAMVESDKFAAEQRKLIEKSNKLAAEATKFQRDTSVAPWLAGGAVAGGILTGATLLLRALGVLS